MFLVVFFFHLITTVFCKSDFELPKIPYDEILSLDSAAYHTASIALISIGALQITNIPGYKEARYEALHSLATCLDSDKSVTSMRIHDGSRRLTTTAGNVNGKLNSMDSTCGSNADKLRYIVHNTIRQFMVLLDTKQVLLDSNDKRNQDSNKRLLLDPYETFSSLVDHGNHLEHMHSYYSPSNDTSDSLESFSSNISINLHTDGGLFIGMTPGYYVSEIADSVLEESAGLYIEMPTGILSKVSYSDDSLILMIGEAGNKWLAPKLGQPLRSVPHLLITGLTSKSGFISRSWYGKMFLPPLDAKIVTGTSTSISYATYRAKEVEILQKAPSSSSSSSSSSDRDSSSSSSIVSVCGPATPLSAQDFSFQSNESGGSGSKAKASYNYALSAVACSDSEVYCWTNCVSTADLACGQQAQCVDTVTGQVVDGTDHCPEENKDLCQLQCVPGWNSTAIHSDYCSGYGVSMYMDGFHSIVIDQGGETSCVNILFPDWTLNSKLKMFFGCMGVMILGIFCQYLSYLRTQAVDNLSSILLYGIHIVISYFLMLITMSYNVELFCMVCVGLILGHTFFHTNMFGRRKKFPAGYMPPEADPCCDANHIEEKDKYKLLEEEKSIADRSPSVNIKWSKFTA